MYLSGIIVTTIIWLLVEDETGISYRCPELWRVVVEISQRIT